MKIFIDFETRSRADLKKVGAWQYAGHPSTEVLCAGVAINDADPFVLIGDDLRKLKEMKGTWVGHNISFERAIWKRVIDLDYGVPCPHINFWKCTSAKAAHAGLPRKLETVALFLKLNNQKDPRGEAAIKRFCKPLNNKTFSPLNGPTWETLLEYCIQDVRVCRELESTLPDMSQTERLIWEIDQEINDRGVEIDLSLIEKILDRLYKVERSLETEFKNITDGFCTTPKKVKAFKEWLEAQGEITDTLKKSKVSQMLAVEKPNAIRRALEIRQELSRSSTAKYKAFISMSDKWGRLRNNLIYHGAHTGRWTGSGVQLQNLPRGEVDAETVIDNLNNPSHECFNNPMQAFSSAIRGVIIAKKGKKLIVGDFASIEARILAWLTQETKLLDAFKKGEDIYCLQASTIFNRLITPDMKKERLVGKTAILALGYGGGVGAFSKMAEIYGVDLESIHDTLKSIMPPHQYQQAQIIGGDDRAAIAADLIKQKYRESNPRIPEFWKQLEKDFKTGVTGKKTIRDKYTIHSSSPLKIEILGLRHLSYWKAECDNRGRLSYYGKIPLTGKWGLVETYGGKLTENLVQAIARDVLAHALIELRRNGFPPVLTVHDEIICEVEPDRSIEDFKRIMELKSSRGAGVFAGLPLEVDAWEGTRYKK